ncbi:MAG: ABC transporter ATP-binding protein [Terracidiphilus sp.]
MTEVLLEARGLRKAYDNGRMQALRGVDVDISVGEFLAIMGPSGSGKSTLLHLLGGLDAPSGGQVLWRGVALGSGRDLDVYRSRHVGFVFQAFHLLPTLTVLENVQVPMLAAPRNGTNRVERARALLGELGLDGCIRQYPNELSGGQRQRAAIARALANQPELLLADEPTGNLDSENSARILDVLTELQKRRGMTLVIVTHENGIAQAAERQICIRDGRIA